MFVAIKTFNAMKFVISIVLLGTSLASHAESDPVYASMIKAYLLQNNEAEAIRVVPYLENVNYQYDSGITLFSLAGNIQANKLSALLLKQGADLTNLQNRQVINFTCINANLPLLQTLIDYGVQADYLLENAGEVPSCIDYALQSKNSQVFAMVMDYGTNKRNAKFCDVSILDKANDMVELKAIFHKHCPLKP